MIESILVLLFICSPVEQQCQPLGATKTIEQCEEFKKQLIETRGNPPEGTFLQCVKYVKEEPKA